MFIYGFINHNIEFQNYYFEFGYMLQYILLDPLCYLL